MTADKTGRIIWHDLFTSDLKRSMKFYEEVAGWNYVTEHATDFAWGGGEKDFVLALLDEEAGAGFTDTPPELSDGWVAYVEVQDVDATTALAEKLGGTIVRDPFEVPGVGRNALLRDPNGALFGVSLSRHSFRAPTKQFGVEIYAGGSGEFPAAFYTELFDWAVETETDATARGRVIGPSGDVVAEVSTSYEPVDSTALWIPTLKNADLKSAERAGAKRLDPDSKEPYAVLLDPAGVLACLRHGSPQLKG
ncbi:MAG: VOC family protein [Pseudomonadota bacterium]